MEDSLERRPQVPSQAHRGCIVEGRRLIFYQRLHKPILDVADQRECGWNSSIKKRVTATVEVLEYGQRDARYAAWAIR